MCTCILLPKITPLSVWLQSPFPDTLRSPTTARTPTARGSSETPPFASAEPHGWWSPTHLWTAKSLTQKSCKTWMNSLAVRSEIWWRRIWANLFATEEFDYESYDALFNSSLLCFTCCITSSIHLCNGFKFLPQRNFRLMSCVLGVRASNENQRALANREHLPQRHHAVQRDH